MRVMNSILCAILLLLSAKAAAAPDLPTYAVTDLKALGIWPVAMNGRGDVVGRGASDTPGTSPTHTYLFSAGSVTELFPPTDAPNATYPVLLNDAGHVVFETNTYTGWVYDGVGYRRIEPPAPADAQYAVSYFRASGLNAAGQIAGEVSYQSSGPAFGSWAWLDDRGMVQVLNPLGARSCGVRGLTKWGDVALMCDFGFSTEQGQVYKYVLGVRYRDGSWREIDDRYVDLVGINDSRAVLVGGNSDVPSYLLDDAGTHTIDPICDEGSSLCRAGVQTLNDRGEVVGLSSFNTSTPQLPQVRTIQRALLWRNGLSTDISPPGNGNSRAWSINNHGVAVGTYINEAGKERPFIHVSGTSMDLAELRGVGEALDLALAESNSVGVEIVDSGHILVTSVWMNMKLGLYVLNGAHLLSPVVPTLSLTTTGTSVQVGTPVTLTWGSQNANYCVAGGGTSGDGWAGERATTGQATLTSNLAATVQYSMRCSAGPVSGNANVSVVFDPVSPNRKSGGGGYMDVLAVLGLAGLRLSRRRKH